MTGDGHHLVLHTDGRHVWAACTCEWKGPLRSTVARASEDFGDHQHEAAHP